MANLILNGSCKRKCPYCFAKGGVIGEFSFENFKRAVNFIQTGPPVIHLLGGEPTEHPQFTTFIEYLMDQKMIVRIFTNGMVQTDRRKNIKSVLKRMEDKHGKLDILFNVNVNNPKIQTEEERSLQNKFFEEFNLITYIGHTIYDDNEDLIYLKDTILDFKLDPAIRLGLALPIFGGENLFLSPNKYRTTATNVLNLCRTTNTLNIEVHFDCGFPMCMFTFDEISETFKSKNNVFSFSCGQPLDVYSDLSVTNCFPLSKVHKAYITEFKNMEALVKYYEDGMKTAGGIYDKCRNCFYFNYACAGGCKALYLMNKEGTINEAY